jgi:hypothetical protein
VFSILAPRLRVKCHPRKRFDFRFEVRTEATNAIKLIDPEAAKAAGVN